MPMKSWVLLLVACTPAAAPPAPMPPAAPAPTVPAPAPAPSPAPTATATRTQSADTKLHLGHYSNARRGIGVVIDLTERTENVADVDPAKLRFDGETKVYHLLGRRGSYGRFEYGRDSEHTMLVVGRDGDVTVFVPDPDGKPSAEIQVLRDGDADPL